MRGTTGMIYDALHKNTVISPSHYTQGRTEALDTIRDTLGPPGFEAYCLGNTLKYLLRARHKGKSEEDYRKAHFYLSAIIGVDMRKAKDK